MSIPNIESIICPKCDLICLNDCILCEICKTWVHSKCFKISKRQLSLYSSSTLPYFCPTCISSVIPFSHVTNAHIDQFNSIRDPIQTNHSCSKCLKFIKHNNLIECKLGKHFLHKKCTDIISTTNINRSTWSCNDCQRFPFRGLDNTLFISEACDSSVHNHDRRAKLKLNHKISELKNTLPKITITNPSNHDTEIDINFSYYDLNQFVRMSSNLNQYVLFPYKHTFV